MKKRISSILPLLFITLGCVLFVEGLYKATERYLFVSQEGVKFIAQVPEKKQSSAISKHSVDDHVRIVLGRNLFGPAPATGKEAKAEGSAVDDLQATSLELVLMGTVIGAKNESRAIILEKAKKTQDIYQLGETVQGATLKEILRGKVVLNYNSKDEILDMTEAAKYFPNVPAAAGPVVRQEQTLPAPVQQEAEAQPQDPDQSPAVAQPKTIRPNRKANTQMPVQPPQ